MEEKKRLTRMPLLMLGRDGMGAEATEDDFDSWVAFVVARIGDACGFPVEIEKRSRRDELQNDAIVWGHHDERTTVQTAKEKLWERWCAEGATPQTGDKTASWATFDLVEVKHCSVCGMVEDIGRDRSHAPYAILTAFAVGVRGQILAVCGDHRAMFVQLLETWKKRGAS